MSYNHFNIESLKVLFTSIKEDWNIIALTLSGNKISDNLITPMIDFLLHCPILRVLRLEEVDITDKSLPLLTQRIKDLKDLQSLYLSDNKFTHTDLLSDLISNLPLKLNILSLKHCDCNESIIPSLSQYIWSNNTLQMLDLSNNRFGIECDDIFEMFPSLICLEQLYFNGIYYYYYYFLIDVNCVSSMTTLSQSLSRLSTLTNISLSSI